MFRNPVYDLFVVLPALLIAGLVGFFVMTSAAHAAEPAATSSGHLQAEGAEASTLIVTREGMEEATSTAVTYTARAITSADQLLAYANTVLAKDPYIAMVALSGSGIAVSYRRQGRFLGLLPVDLPTTARVRSDGSVQFEEPWYGAVTLAEKDRMKTALEVRAHALLTSEGYLSSMSLSPSTQAELLDLIRELLA